MLNIAIAGASGYAGGEALRLLLNHPGYGKEFTIGALTGGSNAGARFGDLVPSLPQLADRELQETTPETLAEADAVILALPHGVSAALAKNLPDTLKVVDCGADFRLINEADWKKYYGTDYAGSRTYGIPEIPGNRQTIAASNYVAAPGCFPTGATLAALPGIAAGLLEPELSVVSITGVSGAGKKAAVNLLGAETMGNLRAYGVGTHRHTPEMVQNLSAVAQQPVKVTFTPVLAPLTRGILTTVTAATTATEQQLRAAYEEFCATEPFLHLLPAGQQPETKNVVGSNMTHIQVAVVDGTAVVTSAIDNLTKGTAGAAVQCLNLMFGWEETAGLPQTGI